ncbi:MAG: tRNA (adenosine(37)-N6)-threonylcarbamoyltransferase complex dimerization subunit type 1 TsaB [Wenzhouxiangellaceae bacterium]
MNRLAIETANECCQVALESGGERAVRRATGPRIHGTVLLPWIEELLAEAGIAFADLDALIVDRGPGAFTSLRLGIAVAQGIALAHDLRCYPVSSLAALAATAAPPGWSGRLLAVSDARMGEVYAACFEIDAGGLPRPVTAEAVSRPDHIVLPASGSLAVTGSGRALCMESLKARLGARPGEVFEHDGPNVEALFALAGEASPVSAEALQPVYLRDQVANR